MGIWDFIGSASDAVKRNAPDLTPVKNACRSSYSYSSAAVSKIDNVIRVNGIQKLNHYWSDGESRAMIGLFAVKLAENAGDYAVREGFKAIPGGNAVYDIATQTLRDVKSENHKDQEMKEVKVRTDKQEKESIGSKKLLDQTERLKQDVGSQELLCSDSLANQKPEDVLRIFMMKEFMGTRFLDDLMVRRDTGRKKHE